MTHEEPLEQSVTEIPLGDITRLRNTRITNQKFPLCRNSSPEAFRSKESYLLGGGLTVRWIYTRTYESAAERHRKRFKECSLERFGQDECLEQFRIEEPVRRYAWRGDTVPGGAYQQCVISLDEIEVIDIDLLPMSDSPSAVKC